MSDSDPVALVDEGRLYFEVWDSTEKTRARVRLRPAADGAELELHDDGVTAYQWMRAPVPGAELSRFVAELRAVLDGPGGDCGTHGFWVLEAEIDLPLASGPIRARAEETKGFSSEPACDVLDAWLQRLAQLPCTECYSWVQWRTARRRRRWAIAGAVVWVLAGLIWLAN